MPTIILDPGHCSYGADTGAAGNGLKEQDITLDICKQLKPLLEYNGIEVIMTRTGDLVTGLSNGYTLGQSISKRVAIANAANADLFVSVHINSVASVTANGVEVLIYGTGGNAEKLAAKVLPQIIAVSGWTNRGIKVRTDLGVLSGTSMPAILTESGFISNAQEAGKLGNADFRKALAVAHAQGICDYFGVTYKEESVNVGEDYAMDHAVVYFTEKDKSWALLVSEEFGGCAIFPRNGGQIVHKDALAAKHLVIVGGPQVLGHPNVTYLAGNGAIDTAKKVIQYLESL